MAITYDYGINQAAIHNYSIEIQAALGRLKTPIPTIMTARCDFASAKTVGFMISVLRDDNTHKVVMCEVERAGREELPDFEEAALKLLIQI